MVFAVDKMLKQIVAARTNYIEERWICSCAKLIA